MKEFKADNLELDRLAVTIKNIPVFVGTTETVEGETVTTGAETAGVIKRGQVIDLTSGTYVAHATPGKANVVAFTDIAYEAGATDVIVPVYVTAKLRKSELVSTADVTAADKEALRVAGIILG